MGKRNFQLGLTINKRALSQQFKSKEALNACLNQAHNIQGVASGMFGARNYGVRAGTSGDRARAFVYTGDRYAIRSNAVHNTLLKALHQSKKR